MTLSSILSICGGGALLIVAVVGVLVAQRNERRLAAIQSTSRATAHDMISIYQKDGAYGQLCEVAGTIECDTTLNTPLSEQPCVAYSHTARWEEWAKAGIWDRRRDADGMVYRAGGTELDDRQVPTFWVRDDSGRILVDPTNAEFDLCETDSRYEVMTASIGGNERRTHREERALLIGPVYVLGYLGERNGQPVIQRNLKDPRKQFFISYRDKEQLTRTNTVQASLAYIVSGIAGSIGMVLLVWELMLRRGH